MPLTNALAGVAVRDINAAKDWYSLFLAKQPDRVPMASDVEWDFPEGSTLQVFEDRKRAGSSSVTLVPDDIDAEVSRLSKLGHKPEETSSGMFRIAIFADPDGNRIVLAQPA